MAARGNSPDLVRIRSPAGPSQERLPVPFSITAICRVGRQRIEGRAPAAVRPPRGHDLFEIRGQRIGGGHEAGPPSLKNPPSFGIPAQRPRARVFRFDGVGIPANRVGCPMAFARAAGDALDPD